MQVESALVMHPLCAEAAVVACPHAIKGEVGAGALRSTCAGRHRAPTAGASPCWADAAPAPPSQHPATRARQGIYAFVTLMAGTGHPPPGADRLKKELAEAVSEAAARGCCACIRPSTSHPMASCAAPDSLLAAARRGPNPAG